MKPPEKIIKVKETTLNEIAQDIARKLGNLPLHQQRALNYALLHQEPGRAPCPVCCLQRAEVIEIKSSHHLRPRDLVDTDDLLQCKPCDTFFVFNNRGWQLAQPFTPAKV